MSEIDQNQRASKSLSLMNKINLGFIGLWCIFLLLAMLVIYKSEHPTFQGAAFTILPLAIAALVFDSMRMRRYLQFRLNAIDHSKQTQKSDPSYLIRRIDYINKLSVVAIVSFLGIFISHYFNQSFALGTCISLLVYCFCLIIFHLIMAFLADISTAEAKRQ